MNKNPIGLHILFAILGLGVSLLLLGVGGQFILDMNRYDAYGPSYREWAAFGFSVGGACCLFFSIALIMRMKWARIAFQVLLILGGITWLIFMVSLIQDSQNAWAVVLGMTVFGITIAIFGILFLESPHFLRDMQQAPDSDSERWDILDQ